MVRIRNSILLLGLALPGFAAVADTSPEPNPDDSTFVIEQVFVRRPDRPCGTLALASSDAIPHADCGMGRHCPDDTRCCMTSSDFWCCPAESKCDYDQPGNCRAK